MQPAPDALAFLPSPQPLIRCVLFTKTHFLHPKEATTGLQGMTHLQPIASF